MRIVLSFIDQLKLTISNNSVKAVNITQPNDFDSFFEQSVNHLLEQEQSTDESLNKEIIMFQNFRKPNQTPLIYWREEERFPIFKKPLK